MPTQQQVKLVNRRFAQHFFTSESSLRHSGMACVYLQQTRLSTNRVSHTCLYSQHQSITTLWPVLISRPAEGRRLSWPGRLVIYRWFACPKTVTHPGTNQARGTATLLKRPTPLLLHQTTRGINHRFFIKGRTSFSLYQLSHVSSQKTAEGRRLSGPGWLITYWSQ